MQNLKYLSNKVLSQIVYRLLPAQLPDIGPIATDKPRILYIVTKYPEFSETYIHEEIVAAARDYEVRILDYEHTHETRERGLPHIYVKYRDSNIVYGSFKNINTRFSNPAQKHFVRAADHIIKEFKPDLMHGHYFPNIWLMRFLADRHNLPFTIRTHSFDMLRVKPERMRSMLEAADTALCRKIFGFPEFRKIFLDYGVEPEKLADAWPICKVDAFYDESPRQPTRRVMCAGPCTPKKGHEQFVDLAALMADSGYEFDLYARGYYLDRISNYNESKGNPVNLKYVDPEDMPGVYRDYDWLIYPLNQQINKVGLPVAVVEAQASGIGVCLQESPGRRDAQLEFLGGGGYLFNSVSELPDILQLPYPEEMRLAGLRNCRKCDVSVHKAMLDDAWQGILQGKRQ